MHKRVSGILTWALLLSSQKIRACVPEGQLIIMGHAYERKNSHVCFLVTSSKATPS